MPLEPEKTQEIALKNFVRLSDVPPPLFERGYYLTPQKEAVKAYRLLAEVMERRKKAGIATFVMRDREYVVAIFARSGILCAATLRFGDELARPVVSQAAQAGFSASCASEGVRAGHRRALGPSHSCRRARR